MKLLKATLLAASAGAMTLGMGTATAQQNSSPSVPIEVWSLRDIMPTVQVSPDGSRLMLLKLESKEGEYIMEIHDTADLSKRPIRTNADPMEIINARWVNDRYIFGTAWQVKRRKVNGPEEDVRDRLAFAFDTRTKKFSKVSGNFNIVNNLPNDDDNVLVATGTLNTGGTGVDPFAAFRPRSYYKFNLRTGSRSLVLRGSTKYPTAVFDDEGNPRFTNSYNAGSKEQISYYRKPGDGNWKEFARYDLDEYENLYRVLGGFHGLVGFKQGDPNTGYIIDNVDSDKAALYEFDFETGQLGTKLYENPDADVMNIQTSSMTWAGDNKLVAARYPAARRERHWFDMEEKALYENLEKEIPYAHSVTIGSRSRDGKTMVVHNIGPRDPGSWWLVRGDSMVKIGSRNPLLRPEQLSDVEFIKYPARDGKTIPAYVTKPKGEGPFPLIVLPHGGPHVNEVIGFDEWGQLLANAGYMVLQPQYRISVGWGQDHFDSGYGEHGLAMQDDKDDGALYMIEQGLADPDRVAMFGWSYGGYAALVAASRSPNIYQCTIAGAAVADAEKVYIKRRNPNSPKALDDWGKRRGMIGINPVNEVDKVNIPVFMVHGDVDARVLYFNFEDYQTEFKKAGLLDPRVTVGDDVAAVYDNKDQSEDTQANASAGGTVQQAGYQPKHRFVTLKGADHFGVTLMYNHQEKLYTELLDFLKRDCGPGGL